MSYSDFENWNPMAEDYSCPKFNNYNDMNSSHLYDLTGLYVKNVPAHLTEESFLSLMTQGGRVIKRHHLYPPKPNSSCTCGLVSFTTEEYARSAMQSLNRKPPFDFIITYANKKQKDNRNALRDQNATPAACDSQLQNNLHKTEKGQAHQDFVNIPNLKVVLDGGKRSTFHKSPVCHTSDKKQDKLPALISNPFLLCLFCKKVAKHSCEICVQPYCSQKCQEEDWTKHKALCLPFDKGNQPSQSKSSLTDSSYMSEGSSCSDNDKNSELTCPRNTNIPSKKLLIHEASKCQKKITFIDANEIEETPFIQKSNVKVHISGIKSPSCFWVQLESSNSLLSQMEKEMSTSVEKAAVPCTVNNVCCVNHKGRLKRAKILEIKSSTSLVHFIDYGDSSTFHNDQLFHLPQVFKKYPAQAICCNLVDSSKDQNIQWSKDEISAFSCFTSDETYSAHVHGRSNKIYDVSLFNEDGVSVFTMVSVSLTDVQDSTPKCLEIPSVWENLKQGMEVNVVAVEFENDNFWGVLDDATDLNGTMKEIEDLLVTINSPDISISCEEGDIAVGLSPSFQCYYRCVVLKRLRSSFLVHYIDYGNKEEVTKLCALPSNLIHKKSYVMCCTKPASLSHEEFRNLFKSGSSGCVKAVKSSFAELTFQDNAKTVTLNCYPWHHGIVPESLSKQSVNNKCSKNSSIPINIPIQLPTKILKDAIVDKNINHSEKYDVKVVTIKTSSEMYVQLTSEEKELVSFLQKLNQYCNSSDFKNKYVPVKDEIVCCKFSEDGNWYRGQVLANSVNGFRVLFIDFGNEEDVSDKDIKPLPEKFACSKYSICVALCNIKKTDMISKELISILLNETWTMEIQSSVINNKSPVQVMLSQGKKSLIHFIKRSKSSFTIQKLPVGQSVSVEICYVDKNRVYLHQQKDKKSIDELCAKINNKVEKSDTSKVLLNNIYCGLFKDGLWYRVCVNQEISPNSYMVTFIDFGNKEEVSSNNLKELPDDLLSYPVFCVPVTGTNFDAACVFDGKTYTVEVIGEKNNIQEVKFCNLITKHPVSSFLGLKLENGKNDILFCYFENNTHYCHLNSYAPQLLTMSNKLQTCVKKRITPDDLSVGDVYCVKSIDGCWYRASIENIKKRDSSCKVLFIDYGNAEVVTIDDIMLLPEELHDFPIFSIPVKISNLNKNKAIALDQVASVKTVGKTAGNVQLVELIPEKEDLPKIGTLKKQVLPVDKKVNISICHVEKDLFYCHMQSSLELIKSLESKLLKATEFSDIGHFPEVGDVLCAKFTDGIWYRGTVEKICGDKSCQISFIDYGNSEVISVENMKILPTSLCCFPVFSIPITVQNIEVLQEVEHAIFMVKVVDVVENVHIVEVLKPKPVVHLPSQILPLTVPKDNAPIAKSVQHFKYASLTRRFLPLRESIEVVFFHKEQDIMYLQQINDGKLLKDMEAEVAICSALESLSYVPVEGELLCAKSSMDGLWYRGSVTEVLSSNKYKIHFVDYGNSENISIDNLRPFSDKLITYPSLSIAVKIKEREEIALEKLYIVIAESESCDNVQLVKLEKANVSGLEKRNETCSESLSNEKSNSSSKFYVKDIEKVEFSSGEQEVIIYYVPEDCSYVFCAPFIQKNITNSYNLISEITEYCNNLDCTKYNGSNAPEQTEMVLAKYEEDKQWYRAVVCTKEPPFYDVLFVDYGNYEQLHEDSLRRMEPQFMSLEIQTHICKLTGFTFDEENKPAVLEELKNFIMSPLKAVVNTAGEDITVCISIITDTLIKKNLVTRKN